MQTDPVASRLREARSAFERGDWPEAREIYDTLVAEDPEIPEALDGLGETMWFMCEIAEGVALKERSYACFQRAGDVCRAADTALWLSVEYSTSYGSEAVANGWFRRAERLLEDAPLCVARAELEVLRGWRAADPPVAEQHYVRAFRLAQELGYPGMEIRVLAQLGMLKVSLGQLDEGMALLDEVAAAATGGELRSPRQIGSTCCSVLSACDQTSDFERAVQWCRRMIDLTERLRYTPLLPWCRAIYAGTLIQAGDWERAEEELRAALQAYGGSGRPMAVYPLARLAELRLRQGRIEEAVPLVSGHEDHPRAVEVGIELLIERGELGLAEERLEWRLHSLAADHPRATPLLRLLVDLRLRKGDAGGAREASDRLMKLAQVLGNPVSIGTAEFWVARVHAAGGDAAASAHFEMAFETFRRLGMPHEEARARLGLACELAAQGSAELALAEARSALEIFERLGARRDVDAAAALLRSLGAASRAGPRGLGKLTRREREVLELLGYGLSNPDIAERLFISPKTAEHHVSHILRKLDLRSRQEAASYAVRQAVGRSGSK
jgi:DNA-binding CsgD family transcriptional regulator